MLVPEVILYNSLQSLLQVVTDDWNNNADKTQTILHDLFATDDNGNPISITNYDYYRQAQAILLRNSTSPKKLEFFIGYNLQRQTLPTIHIIMPNDSRGNMDNIGDSEGEPVSIIVNDQQIITKTKSNSAVFNLMITSDNSSEVLVIYYFLKGIMLMFDHHFELSGFLNFQFNGADINLRQEFAPNNVFYRNLSVSFNYNSSVTLRQSINQATGLTAAVCDDIVNDFIYPDQVSQ